MILIFVPDFAHAIMTTSQITIKFAPSILTIISLIGGYTLQFAYAKDNIPSGKALGHEQVLIEDEPVVMDEPLQPSDEGEGQDKG